VVLGSLGISLEDWQSGTHLLDIKQRKEVLELALGDVTREILALKEN